MWGRWGREITENWPTERLYGLLKVTSPGPGLSHKPLWLFLKITQHLPKAETQDTNVFTLPTHILFMGLPTGKESIHYPHYLLTWFLRKPGISFSHNLLKTQWDLGRALLSHSQPKESVIYSNLHKPTFVLTKMTSFWHKISTRLIAY